MTRRVTRSQAGCAIDSDDPSKLKKTIDPGTTKGSVSTASSTKINRYDVASVQVKTVRRKTVVFETSTVRHSPRLQKKASAPITDISKIDSATQSSKINRRRMTVHFSGMKGCHDPVH